MFSMNSCFCTCRNWTSVEQFSSGFQTTSREDPKRLFYMDMYLRNFPALRVCPRAEYWGRFSSTFMLLTQWLVGTMFLYSHLLTTCPCTVRGRPWTVLAATALTTIFTELDRRGLKINCEKTSAMLICTWSNGLSKAVAGESSLANITCDGKKIPLVSNTRLLGVIVDSNLSWKDHVDQVWIERLGLSGDPSSN